MYKKVNKVNVKITNITLYGAFCRAEKAYGLIHISDISDYFVRDIKDFFTVGYEIKVEVLDFNKIRKHLKLSYKNCHFELLKNYDGNEIQEKSPSLEKTLNTNYLINKK